MLNCTLTDWAERTTTVFFFTFGPNFSCEGKEIKAINLKQQTFFTRLRPSIWLPSTRRLKLPISLKTNWIQSNNLSQLCSVAMDYLGNCLEFCLDQTVRKYKISLSYTHTWWPWACGREQFGVLSKSTSISGWPAVRPPLQPPQSNQFWLILWLDLTLTWLTWLRQMVSRFEWKANCADVSCSCRCGFDSGCIDKFSVRSFMFSVALVLAEPERE